MSFLIIIGAVATAVFSLPYAWATLQGKIQPNRLSWLLWTVAPGIGLVASVVQVGWQLSEIPVLISVLATATIATCSLLSRKSYWELTRFDWICGGVSGLALLGWAFTKNADLAIVLSMLADFLAVLPTLVKAWRQPETEISGPYLVGIFNAATSFFVMSVWNFASLAFPIYLVFANGILAFAILRKRIWRGRGE